MDAPLATSPAARAGLLRLIPRPHHVILGVILLVGAALRYYGLNWDFGSGLHPDERHVISLVQALALPTSWAQFLSPGHVSPLEPGDFAYGSLPIYLYWIVGHVAAWLGSWVPGLSAWQNALGSGVFLTGRIISATAGVLTIPVVYLLGVRAYAIRPYGRTVGLLGAAFFAVCVLDVQLSHFLAVDTLTVLFATLAVYYCVRVAQQRRPADFLWAGAWTGAALACKVSVLPLLLPLVVAPFLTGDQATGDRRQATDQATGDRRQTTDASLPPSAYRLPPTVWGRVGWLLAAVGALLAVFVITQPYALIDWSKYLSDVEGQARLASGQDHVFYTVKFYGTPPYWYHLEHIVPWDLGWPLGLAAVAGVLAATWRSIVRRRRDEAVLLLWTLAYFGATGGQFMKYVRYMLPIMPPLCVFAAALLLAFQATGDRRQATEQAVGDRRPTTERQRVYRLPPTAYRLATALSVLALTVLYALAYDNIYSTLNTRLAASVWFETHVKPDTPFTVENLDEGIPWSFDAHPVPPGYTGTSIGTAAGGDTLQSWTGGVRDGPPTPGSFAAVLAPAQYVTISSDRIMGTVPHLPQAFPYARRYYCLLFGRHPPAGFQCPRFRNSYPLGFRLVKYFSNHPHIFGITLDDYPADQNFSEYDHPPVWIFKRVRAVSPAQTAALITNNGRVHDVPQVAVPDKSLLLTPKEQAVNATGPSYAQEFPSGSLPMRLPVLFWLAWLEGLGLLALPLAMRLFRRLPDRGFVLAKTVGLLLVAYLTWLAASLHLLRFALPTILGAAGLVALASLLWGVPLREVGAFWRAKRSLIERAEWVFLAGFFADVVVRMIYPDLWHAWNGGEKPMDFSYLNGLVRSQTMPPADPWFAGGYMNYYYYGYFLLATLIKLTGIAPSVAYNLAVPTLFGLTLASAYTIGYALTRRTGIALLAAGLTALAGNLYAGVQVAAVLTALSPVHLALPVLGGAVDLLGGLWQLVTQQWLLHHQAFPAISFRGGPSGWGWDSTRVIDPGNTINEFPFFTFLYADLHAHMIDLPVLLTGIALAASAALGARPWRAGERGEVRRAVLPGAGLVMLLVTAVVVGSTGPTNTWDVITALLLVALGVAASIYTAGAGLRLALASAALFGAVLAALAAGMFYPFYSHLKSFYSTIGFTLAHTALNQFLMVWGLFLFIVASYVAVELWRGAMGVWLRRQARAGEFVLYYWPRRARVLRLMRAVGVQQRIAGRVLAVPQQSLGVMAAGVLLAAVALAMGAPVLALLLLLLAADLAALLDRRQATGDRRQATGQGLPLTPNAYRLSPEQRRFTLLLALLALGLAAVCEVAYLADFLAGGAAYRMNTVFKLYEQAWPLFAIASAAALAAMMGPQKRPAWPGPRIGLKPDSTVGIVAAPIHRRQATDDRRQATGEPLPPTAYRLPPSPLRRLWLATLGLLLFAVALYPLLETPAHLAERASSGYWIAAGKPALGPTLDGTAFVQKAFPGEYAALRWLNADVKGDPTVLSSDSGFYDNFGFRVPWMTGLPTVLEWGEEQGQQRYSGQPDTAHWPYAPYPNEVGDRDADVRTIYATTDTALALHLLRKYHVTYVYVGVAERGQQPDPSIGGPPSGCYAPDAPSMPPNPTCVGYPSTGLAKFGAMAASGVLRVVYRRGGVTIYKVVR